MENMITLCGDRGTKGSCRIMVQSWLNEMQKYILSKEKYICLFQRFLIISYLKR